MNLQEYGAQVLERVKKLAPQAQAEAFMMTSSSRSSEWSEGQPENLVIAESHGLGLRIIEAGRLGISFTNTLSAESFDVVARRALESAKLASPDPDLVLPQCPSAPASDLDLVDRTFDAFDWLTRGKFLTDVEKKVRALDPRISKVLRGSYREGHAEIAVVNSEGTARQYSGTSASAGFVCVALEGAETQMGWASHAARHYSDLKTDWAIHKAVENTVALLGGRKIPSGRYDLILDPLIGAEMLELLAGPLRGDFVRKGKSFLAGKINQAIGSSQLTIVDDGRMPRGLGSSPVDAEGWPTQRNVLVEGGVLKRFIYDSYNARKAGTQSTGNAGRGSYKGAPEPDMNNFYIEAGVRSPQEILGSVRAGIYVRNVMGLHTVDTISGDFSLGLSGQLIENGEISHAVRGVTMAGNLFDLLRNIEAVGSDLIFAGSIGSPTLWIRDISVGGA